MSVLFILIGISLLVASLFLAGFIWAVKSGQYDDMYTPAVRILHDDEDAPRNDTPRPPTGNHANP